MPEREITICHYEYTNDHGKLRARARIRPGPRHRPGAGQPAPTVTVITAGD
ncbi:hypothetical protein Ssi03_02360 [Sphaerisporangium siamense]|nr:hypothetical protein Ssi03_02360 [Sphaerisporangium siamense]